MKTTTRLVVLAVTTALSCSGGGQGQAGGPGGPGDTHVGDLDTSDHPPADAGAAESLPGTPDAAPAAGTGATPGSLVTFELKNTGTSDLELAIDKGWGLVLSGYSGKPPKAVAILLFPSFCTASCDLGDDERCPKCDKPDSSKNEIASEQRVVVPAGKSQLVEWDGQIHQYESTKAGRKKCDCYHKVAVPAETYTLRACGLRVTKTADKRSKMQCPTQEVQLPPEAPTRIVFEFPDP